MKDTTLLIAHPDDEAIFLWPFLERAKKIVCVSSDRFNPARDWCKERGDCLREVAKLLGCDVIILDNPSEFYRFSTRDGALKMLAKTVMGLLKGTERLATHNPWGEYGNIDHLICHHVARTWQQCDETGRGREVLSTNIHQEINWLPVKPWPLLVSNNDDLSDNSEGKFKLDHDLFSRIKAIYDAKHCWTWAWEPVNECEVFSL